MKKPPLKMVRVKAVKRKAIHLKTNNLMLRKLLLLKEVVAIELPITRNVYGAVCFRYFNWMSLYPPMICRGKPPFDC